MNEGRENGRAKQIRRTAPYPQKLQVIRPYSKPREVKPAEIWVCWKCGARHHYHPDRCQKCLTVGSLAKERPPQPLPAFPDTCVRIAR